MGMPFREKNGCIFLPLFHRRFERRDKREDEFLALNRGWGYPKWEKEKMGMISAANKTPTRRAGFADRWGESGACWLHGSRQSCARARIALMPKGTQKEYAAVRCRRAAGRGNSSHRAAAYECRRRSDLAGGFGPV